MHFFPNKASENNKRAKLPVNKGIVLLDRFMFDIGLSTESINQSPNSFTLLELEHTIKNVCQGSNTDTYGVRQPARSHISALSSTLLHCLRCCGICQHVLFPAA